MTRMFSTVALVAALAAALPAAAQVSRSVEAEGPYGGLASRSTGCEIGYGCTHSRSKTTPAGETYSGSVKGYPVDRGAPGVGLRPGVGVGAPGVGVRPAAGPGIGPNLGGPVNRAGLR